MTDSTCTIEGCERSAKKRDMCGMHYLRWWRHGDPLQGRPNITKCRVADCENPTRSQSVDLCEKHYGRIRRNGDLFTVVDMRKPNPSYRATHSRLTRDRGPASKFACVDCGQPALHWSYDYLAEVEHTSPSGQIFSADSSHYQPRCVPCHRMFDQEHGSRWP